MLYGRHNRAMNTDVSHRAAKRATARALVALGMSAMALTLGSTAHAVSVVSLQFPSTSVLADGVNATPVLVLVSVVNSGTAFEVNSLSTEYDVVASGTLDPAGLVLSSGTVANPGVFVNGGPSFTINAGGWGVDQNPTPTNTVATGTSNLVRLVFTIPAGVTDGTYTINFLTDPVNEPTPFRSFTNTLTDPDTLYAYANGNNGSTFGVITVVPEPSTGTAIGAATVLMSGVAIAQRRMRRRNSTVELVG